LSNRFTSKNPSTPQGKRGRLRKKKGRMTFQSSQIREVSFLIFTADHSREHISIGMKNALKSKVIYRYTRMYPKVSGLR
jgi:hypothetical protein